MFGFRVQYCNSHKKNETDAKKLQKHTSAFENMLDCSVNAPKTGSIFLFNGKKWTSCVPQENIWTKRFGKKGYTGPKGNIGPTGSQGPTGSIGLQGIKGDTGPIGLQGPTGSIGIKGDTGPIGLQGPTGSQGIKGDTGPIGLQGPTGSQGIKGDTGPIGLQGPTGPRNINEAYIHIQNKNTIIGIECGTGNIINTFYGYKAGNSETSSENTYIGHLAGSESVSIGKNVFVGNEVGKKSCGVQNTYVGDNVCSENHSEGSYNTMIGAEAGLNITTGQSNTFIGTIAGSNTTEGSYNTFIGQSAGNSNINGINNIFIGSNSGNDCESGNGCICIGDGSDVSNSNAVNQIVIGQNVIGYDDNTITFPDDLTSYSNGTEVNFISSGGGCLYPVSSSKRWKENIKDIKETIDTSKLYKLRPVSFTTKIQNNKDIGLIAEEVNEYFPLLVPKDKENKPASVRYSMLTVLLLEEIKKLNERIIELEKNK